MTEGNTSLNDHSQIKLDPASARADLGVLDIRNPSRDAWRIMPESAQCEVCFSRHLLFAVIHASYACMKPCRNFRVPSLIKRPLASNILSAPPI